MKASPILNSLNAGELSPEMSGRSDLSKYQSSCALLENFLPLVEGPITRRAGFRYVTPVKDESKRAWLVRFEFSATQSFILEFGDSTVRFFTQRGQLLVDTAATWVTSTAYSVGDLRRHSGGVYYCLVDHTSGTFATDLLAGYWFKLDGGDVPDAIYEIPSPYPASSLTSSDGTCALAVVQSGDVLYIANKARTFKPMKLTRHGNLRWVFTEYRPAAGPFLSMNTSATTIQADGQTGTVNLTASTSTFSATDVGRLVRLESQNLSVKPWETNKEYDVDNLVRYGGKVYKALNKKDSGTAPPIHERGTAYDGKDGVQWEYQHAHYGVVRITSVTSGTAAAGVVVTDDAVGLNMLPADVVSGATTRWQLGAWSESTEYPGYVTFFRNRLWWFGRLGIWASVPNDFENLAGDFFGEVSLDCAIWASLQSEDVNDILWAIGTTRLVIGTPGGEFIGGEITITEPLGPGNFKIEQHGKRRSRSVHPLAIGDALVYVQRAGRRLMAMYFRVDREQFVSSDLALLAKRMTRSGIVATAYQAEPYSAIWCAMADGRLAGFTYDQDQEVTGWHRHKLGGNGVVESVATVPSPDGLGEDLWMIVRRTIDGQTRRYVEYLERGWEGPDNDGLGGDAQADAFYVDSGLTYDGAPASTISGLEHLEGETVQVLADGATHPDCVVDGGQITLNAEYSKVHVGLKCPARMVTHDLEAGGNAGTSQGKLSRIYRVAVRFIDTLGGFIGVPDPVNLSNDSILDEIDFRVPADDMDAPPPITSGIVDMVLPGNWEYEKRIEIRQEQPLPMTVAAIMPRLHVHDR